MKFGVTSRAALGLVLSCVACAAPVSESESDVGAGENAQSQNAQALTAATDEVEAVATTTPSNFGYVRVTRRDLRKCASPWCGGYFVERVNREQLLCADGLWREECYVSEIRYGGIGLSEREESELQALVESGRAILKARTYRTMWGVGILKANEAWTPATGSPALGTFYRVADNGIRCIKAPCPSTTAFVLNRDDRHNVVEVKLESTSQPSDEATLDRASRALATSEGILVAGNVAYPKCVADTDCGPFVSVSEYFVRYRAREGQACGFWTTYDCNPGQFCSWKAEDICGAADAAGKCAYRPEVCPMHYEPVCGCDGKTHGNACMAAAAGASVSSIGACEAR